MKYNSNIKSSSEILETYFTGLLGEKMKEHSQLDTGWQRVLLNIPKDGDRLAAHSEIKEIKNGYLYIETDHSGWIQLLQLHKAKILRLLRKEFGSLEINDFFFTIREKKD